MKERPVVFSAPMIRAILNGSKTQARYAMHPQPEYVWGWGVKLNEHDFTAHVRYPGGHPPDPWVRCPYGTPPHRECPGDRLWVRETWQEVHPVRVAEGRYSQEGRAGIPGPPGVRYQVVYRADGDDIPVLYHMSGHPYRTLDPCEANLAGVAREDGWSSPIHMPRWASRIILEIVSVRVERLQDITEEDAKAEGVAAWAAAYCSQRPEDELYARAYFELMWAHGDGKRYPWESNPFCWVIAFHPMPPHGREG